MDQPFRTGFLPPECNGSLEDTVQESYDFDAPSVIKTKIDIILCVKGNQEIWGQFRKLPLC